MTPQAKQDELRRKIGFGRLNLIDRYYGHTERLNGMDVTNFLIRTRTILPQYLKLFRQTQEATGVDWRLLAAVSYQE